MCEGQCSGVYHAQRKDWIVRMRAAGFSPAVVRAMLTADMESRIHQFTRRRTDHIAATVTTFYACLTCRHERIYGVEELACQ